MEKKEENSAIYVRVHLTLSAVLFLERKKNIVIVVM